MTLLYQNAIVVQMPKKTEGKIRFSLEYGNTVLQFLDENGLQYDREYDTVTGPLDERLKERISDLEEEYHGLFINDPKEFGYAGFKNEKDESAFFKRAFDIYNDIKEAFSADYEIEPSRQLYDEFVSHGLIEEGTEL